MQRYSERTTMSKQRDEFFDTLLGAVHVGMAVPDYRQRQPYTMCELTYRGEVGIGFTKVCYPDKWSAEHGRRLSLQKAVSHLWEQKGVKNGTGENRG